MRDGHTGSTQYKLLPVTAVQSLVRDGKADLSSHHRDRRKTEVLRARQKTQIALSGSNAGGSGGNGGSGGSKAIKAAKKVCGILSRHFLPLFLWGFGAD